MNRNLFIAWYCLGVLALCLATFWILVPFVGLHRANISFAFAGLIVFVPLIMFFFRKEKFDERDGKFMRRAMSFGTTFGFGSICFITLFLDFVFRWVVKIDSVPMSVFMAPLHCGVVIFVLCYSVLLILLYGKGELGDPWGAEQ